MQVTRATFIPLLAPGKADRIDPAAIRDEFVGDLTVVYTFGPQFGRRVVTHADLEQMDLPAHALRRSALEHLEVLAGRAEFHGQPPALMLSFEGLESSLLLATDFWTRLQGAVPGELVVGVPARDVVVVTGSQSQAGLEKARRCVERIFFAGDDNLLSRGLLVRRGNMWEPFDRPTGGRPAQRPHGPAARHRGPDQMPRQYQEHPSWPGERVPVNPRPTSGGGQRMPGGPMPVGPGVPVGPGPLGAVPVGPVSSGPVGAGRSRGGHGPYPSGPNHAGPSHSAPHQPAPYHTGQMPPVGRHNPMTNTSTGGLPPVRSDYPSNPADVAQYSAVPYSAVPYSGAPYSAVPYSATPYSVAPQSLAPNSTVAPGSAYLQSRGARGPQPTDHSPVPKPRYRDDAYSTGARPLYSYEPPKPSYVDEGRYRDAPRDEPSYRDAQDDRRESYARPAYPDSWGTAPKSARPEFTSGPRARFAR